jgi:hypothetical protein
LNAVKYLQGKNKQVFEFMSLFTSTDSKQFETKVKIFKNLMEEEKLAMEDVIKKKWGSIRKELGITIPESDDPQAKRKA